MTVPLDKNSACSVGSQRHSAAELARVNAHLTDMASARDSGAACVSTSGPPVSALLAVHRCRAIS